jgi:endonuclease/exonuclease/phosphatase family metal-dependent hydrolase
MAKRMLILALLGGGLLFVVLMLLLIWMAGGLQNVSSESTSPTLTKVSAKEITDTSTLSVMTWNVAWAYGKGSEGHGTLKTASEMKSNLDQVAATIKAADPDVVLLQEIDFQCDRSFRTNQAEYLAEQAEYPFFVSAVSWKANYVPFPYWPPSEHWKAMNSGGAILSRYPLKNCRVDLLPKPQAQSFIYRLFYLFRYLQKCELAFGDKVITLYNTHLEAFDVSNREGQSQIVADRIKEDGADLRIFGGDFNTVPADASLRHQYPDEPQTDHRADRTLKQITDQTGLRDTAKTLPPNSEPDLFTFPATAPNRKLDYILVDPKFRVSKLQTLTSAAEASDHLPLLVDLHLD